MAGTAWDHIYELWDELSDFRAADIDQALDYLLERLCQWLDAGNAFWIGAVRVMEDNDARKDNLSGWRAGAVHVLRPAELGPDQQKERVKRLNTDDPGETSIKLAARAGTFRAFLLRDNSLVNFERFQQTDHYQFFYRTLGISDRMWIVFPVSPEAECYYCIDRFDGQRFSASDLSLASKVMRGIKWFHRQLLLSHGLGIAECRMTPTDRRVLQAIVTGVNRKQLAECLGVTEGTAHQYTLTLYRKFGVRSKAELMALWLNERT